MKVLVCDFDETFINQDLELEFVRFYKKKYLKPTDIFFASISIPINMISSFLEVRSLFKAWTVGKDKSCMNEMFAAFFEQSNIQINQSVFNFVSDFEGSRILLTGCLEELAIAFLKHNNLDHVFNKIIGAKTTCNGFFLQRHPFGRSKLKFISSPDVGIGNSKLDRYFLSECKNPIITNPDKELELYAEKYGWREI